MYGDKKNTRMQKNLLMIHVTGQPDDVQYWRAVIPDDVDVKSLLVSELHSCTIRSTPWSAKDDRTSHVITSGGRA